MADSFLGNCPICGGDWKVRDGRLVHHGYRRRGVGYIEGDCPGVGRPPLETSPVTAEWWRDQMRQNAEDTDRALTRLPDLTEMRIETALGKTVLKQKSEVSDHEWKNLIARRERELRARLRYFDNEVERMKKILEHWGPKPLRRIQEEKQKKRAEVDARKAERASIREAKDAVARERLQARTKTRIASLRKKIDGAMKKGDRRTLGSIYYDTVANRGFPGGSQGIVKPEEFLRMLDRDSVWRSLGFMPDGSYLEYKDPRFLPTWRAVT